jgi:hypothetical protein
MKRKLLILAILFHCGILYGQHSDSIFLRDGILGFEFYQHQTEISSYKKLIQISKSNKVASNCFCKARNLNRLNTLIATSGVAIIGWQLGNLLVGQKLKW